MRWVFRHFPLRSIHNRAEPSARASECAADQTDFFAYEALVFGTTDGSSNPILTDAQLRTHAETLGLNLTTFDACFPPGDGKSTRVQQDVNSGTALGVNSTPTFFFNEEKQAGFMTAAEMSEIIERKLAGG